MRVRLGLSWTVVAILVAMAAPVSAAEHVTVDQIDTSAHPQMSFTVTLPPTLAGRELPASAFTITEGGVAITPDVERLPTEDLEVVLLLDVSQSMSGAPLEAAVEAATAFAGQMPDEARIAVVSFATVPTVVSGFTSPVDVPIGLADLEASGETALYDGLVEAAALWEGKAPSRRAIVLLSDGGDTVSSASLEESIVAVLGSEAEFYAVELQSPETDVVPLQRLESATGGTLVAADAPGAIEGIFEEIASVLVSRYVVTYTSESFGPTDISVDVAFAGAAASAAISVQLPNKPSFSPEAVKPVVAPPAAVPVVEEVVPRIVSVGVLGRRELAVFGGALFFAGLWGLIRTLQTPAEKKRQTTWKAPASSGGKALTSLANRASLFAEKRLERSKKSGGLAISLEQSGSSLRPGEFVVLTISFALAGAAIGLILGNEITAVAGALATIAGARIAIDIRAKRRQAKFADQLSDALQLIAGGLQAGHGIIQACDAVASEQLDPASHEFRRLIAETRLGRDFTDALRALGDRVGGEDFRWVVDAIDIHREVGGDLSEVLRTLASTIRSRNQVRRRVQTLSAEGRLSGVVLMALPFVVGGLVSASNPDYLTELFTTSPGRVMLAGGTMLMTAGGLWIHRIVSFKY